MLYLQYDSVYRMQHHIHFDTRLSGDNWQQLPENVRGLFPDFYIIVSSARLYLGGGGDTINRATR